MSAVRFYTDEDIYGAVAIAMRRAHFDAMPEPQGRDANHLYSIESHENYGFWSGGTNDGRQVLMGIACPYLVAYFFDGDGRWTGGQKRRLEFLQASRVLVDGEPIAGQVQTYNIYDERISVRVDQWQRELGFREALIRVKRFVDPEFGIGISDYPQHFAEVISDPDADDDLKKSVLESLPDWEAAGQFVLHWGNDYWLDGSGEVTSS